MLPPDYYTLSELETLFKDNIVENSPIIAQRLVTWCGSVTAADAIVNALTDELGARQDVLLAVSASLASMVEDPL